LTSADAISVAVLLHVKAARLDISDCKVQSYKPLEQLVYFVQHTSFPC